VAAGLLGTVTLNAWWCDKCQMEHDEPGYHDDIPNSLNPRDYPQVGITFDNVPVYHYQPARLFVTADRKEIIKIGGRFLYKIEGFAIGHDEENAYDAQGVPLQPIGRLADDKPIYLLFGNVGFVLKDRHAERVTRIKDGRFVYETFNIRRAYKAFSSDQYHEYFFDGKDWVEWNGNVYNEKNPY
jgi:hypothetical protein